MRIIDLLPVGRTNKIDTADLLQRTGYRNVRDLQRAIRTERENGALILSTKESGGGYYLPGSSAELREFVNVYEREAKSIFAMLTAARREAERLEEIERGQQTLFV